MAFTSEFKTWWFHWFQCPNCSFGTFSAYARAEYQEHPLRLLFRFRCKRCGQDSKLTHPYLNMVTGFIASIILFLVVCWVALLEGGWGISSVLVLLLGVVTLWVLNCALSRFVNRYVSIARVEL
jgi:hypothetical protein